MSYSNANKNPQNIHLYTLNISCLYKKMLSKDTNNLHMYECNNYLWFKMKYIK